MVPSALPPAHACFGHLLGFFGLWLSVNQFRAAALRQLLWKASALEVLETMLRERAGGPGPARLRNAINVGVGLA